MNIEDVRVAKAKILRCLTEDFTYGKTAKGAPLKRPKRNQAIFRAPEGYAVWSKTDLEMVMDAVVLGLYFALDEPNKEQERYFNALNRIALREKTLKVFVKDYIARERRRPITK